MDERPAIPLHLVVHLCLSAIRLDRRPVAPLFRVEMPVELSPCRVAVNVYGNISRRELPLRERRPKELIDSFNFLPAVGMPGRGDEGDSGRSQPDLRRDPDVRRIQGRAVYLAICCLIASLAV
jgi:hypothetical protein